MQTTYKVGDLNKLITESSNEFKAKFGDGVESKNKSINDKAYKEAKKRAQDYDDGLKNNGENPKHPKIKRGEKGEESDFNRTTMDYDINNATPEYKKRVKALVDGYNSVEEENNGIEKTGDREGNKAIYKAFKDKAKEYHQAEIDFKSSGLQGREWPKKTFQKGDMFTESTKIVRFKKTEFLTEGHMISKIPDEMKFEGSRFKMEDKNGNTYLLEWKNNQAWIEGRKDKKAFNESIEYMKHLMGYNSNDYCSQSVYSDRLNENREQFDKSLEISRTKIAPKNKK